jgi:hypothetical protein
VGVFPVAVIIAIKGVSGHEGIRAVPIGMPNPLSETLGEIASAIMSIEPGSSSSRYGQYRSFNPLTAQNEEKLFEANNDENSLYNPYLFDPGVRD